MGIENVSLLKIGDFVDVLDITRPLTELPVPREWYLLRVHPNRERVVRAAFDARDVCCYLPTFFKRSAVPGNARGRNTEVPLFPGLIFVPDFEADLERLKHINEHAAGFVKFGPRTASVNAKAIVYIRELERAAQLPQSQRRRFMVGQGVRVIDQGNPFAYWCGRIDRLDGKGRLRVLLNLLGREVPVDMTEDQVEPE